jgi:hypothetical protein
LEVALPWDRHPTLKYINLAGQPGAGGIFFLTMAGAGLIAAPLVVVVVVVQKRRLRRRFSEEEIRRRYRWQTVVVVLLLGLSALLVLLAGIAWWWADSSELLPGEHYRWNWWYVPWLLATDFLFLPLLLLAVVGTVVARWIWRWWRPRRSAAESIAAGGT